MTVADEYNKIDVLHVTDHRVFGEEIVKIALGKTPNAKMNFADFAAKYPDAKAAMHVPIGLSNADTVEFVQGTQTRHIVNVPPLYKLLPMLTALGIDPATLVGGEQNLGYDPANPPIPPLVVPAPKPVDAKYTYPWPQYYLNLFAGGTLSDQDTFYSRVGDYSVAGCR